MKDFFPRLYCFSGKTRKLAEGGSPVEYLLLVSLLALASVAAGNQLASGISKALSQITTTTNDAFGTSLGNPGNQGGGST
ncbi:MAG: hypothetical protein WBQ95_03270, partial [Terracidiphilus sp.]